MCILTLSPEPCSHSECIEFYKSFASRNSQLPPPTVLPMLTSVIEYQNQFLSKLLENSFKLEKTLNQLYEDSRNLSVSLINPRHSDLVMQDHWDPKQAFVLHNTPLEFSLNLETAFPATIFKERGFPMTVSLRNSNNEASYLASHSRFRVYLFTMDRDPKPLTLNISGKKILRGTTESEMQPSGFVSFSNVVINEVSSHYTKESFCLVIMSVSSLEIKPIIIRNVTIKARRLTK